MAKSARKMRNSTSPAGKRRVKPKKPPATARSYDHLKATQFQKGNGGRPEGSKNKFGVILKDAILTATELSGRDGKGKDGAVGYLVWLSRAEPAVFGRMLEKIMPMQLEVKDTTKRTYTPEEAKAALEARGLPVPQSLTDLVVKEIVERAEDEAIDNSEFEDLAPDTPEIYSEEEYEEEEDEDPSEDGGPEEEAA